MAEPHCSKALMAAAYSFRHWSGHRPAIYRPSTGHQPMVDDNATSAVTNDNVLFFDK
jgi:hypothetical protein